VNFLVVLIRFDKVRAALGVVAAKRGDLPTGKENARWLDQGLEF
jgi:hypothetical protein